MPLRCSVETSNYFRHTIKPPPVTNCILQVSSEITCCLVFGATPPTLASLEVVGQRTLMCLNDHIDASHSLHPLPVISLCTYKRFNFRDSWMTWSEVIAVLSYPTWTPVGLGEQLDLAQEIWFIPFTQTHRLLTLHAWVLEPLLRQL